MKNHESFESFINNIDDLNVRERLSDMFSFIEASFPNLEKRIAWNQPMYTNDKTFIIGFSVAKKHIAIAPEFVALEKFRSKLDEVGYPHSKMLFKIPNDKPVDYALIQEIIAYNIEDKKGYDKFWRT